MTGGECITEPKAGESRRLCRLTYCQESDLVLCSLVAIDETQSAECVALELRVALQALGEIVGIVTNEDILDQIFKEFCIGK